MHSLLFVVVLLVPFSYGTCIFDELSEISDIQQDKWLNIYYDVVSLVNSEDLTEKIFVLFGQWYENCMKIDCSTKNEEKEAQEAATTIIPLISEGNNINDCEALIDLFVCTNGCNWYNKEGWLPLETLKTECCTRYVYGVTCNKDKRVNSTNLAGNRLVGVLRHSIGDLTELVELYLSHNQLQELPSSFGNLSNLVTLGLFGNKLQDLPLSFGNLSNLQSLDLYNNQLQDLPSSFGNLNNLVTLYLREIQLFMKTYPNKLNHYA